MQEIKITCKGADTLPIDRLLEFQPAGLKKRGKKELDKIEASIFKHGLFMPFPIWDDHGEYRLLDGHGRLAVLLRLREQGADIPLLPVVPVKADTEAEAKEMLLQINSQYGAIDTDELLAWTEDIDPDWAEFGLGEFEEDEDDAEKNIYSDKPFKKYHFLISVPLDAAPEVSALLENLPGCAEVETSEN